MKNDRVLLEHIRVALQRIQEYGADGEAVFLQDTRTQDAIIRNFEIIGEAAKGLSPALKDRHSTIQWKQIA
ncbi:MAG: HepT-like ribonuclease domain-containing protein [Fimbriimonadaceae bacterium]